MRKNRKKRIVSMLLSAVMACSLATPAFAAEKPGGPEWESLSFRQVEAEEFYTASPAGLVSEEPAVQSAKDRSPVRVSIFLEEPSVLEAGYDVRTLTENPAAEAYRTALQARQEEVTRAIEEAIGGTLDVVWNLTLTANFISANVRRDQMERISLVPGVKEVTEEPMFELQDAESETSAELHTIPSSVTIGSGDAWAAGLTGAGSRVAVIDTGIDPDHQSFSAEGYEYAMAENAAAAGMTTEEYMDSVDVMTVADITAVAKKLNCKADPAQAYLSSKIPFAYNYVDKSYVIDHDHDSQGGHGSHVEGIVAANRYIPDGEGGFSPAIDSVCCQGVAPDAQLVVMKVFGKAGVSNYYAAIEDAILLGCDAVNLSLGSASPGGNDAGNYQEIFENLSKTGVVITVSAGNSGSWYDTPHTAEEPHLYIEDVSTDTVGEPGSLSGTLTTASADNTGFTGAPLEIGGGFVYYSETSKPGTTPPITSIGGTYEFVMLESVAVDGAGASLLTGMGDALRGKVVLVNRGTSSFVAKVAAVEAAGGVACIVVNNAPESLAMDLSTSTATIPCIAVTSTVGDALRAAYQSTIIGGIECRTGTIKIPTGVSWYYEADEDTTVSSFSSWGVPGALTLKPEITAPGGQIYSVDGATTGGKAYRIMSGTSMAAPQVAGSTALLAQQLRETGRAEAAGLTPGQLITSLLMSTAVPLKEETADGDAAYYPVLRQGAGLLDVAAALRADTFLMMSGDSTAGAEAGKIKAELGDDPQRSGEYAWSFTIYNRKETECRFTLSTELFTQGILELDGERYMADTTEPLSAVCTYLINGVAQDIGGADGADVNGDGIADRQDVQAILNFLAGAGSLADETAADVDGSGTVTTYDAYLLLNSVQSTEVTVPAGGSTTVTVQAALTEAQRTALDADYPTGAYVEGYTFAEPATDAEGCVTDVTHSIPVLGFYGSWTDPSMFDRITVEEAVYSTAEKTPYYAGETEETNGLNVKYSGDSSTYWALGNYYTDSDDICPPERMALNNSATLNEFRYTLIRNAGTVAAVVTAENGSVVWSGTTSGVRGAYYSVNDDAWNAPSARTYSIGKQVGSLTGLTEGERFTVSLCALPEYYSPSATGKLTKAQLKSLVEAGALGKGAALSYTFTLDNTAPEMLNVSRNTQNGTLRLELRDNCYLACVTVSDTNGGTVLCRTCPEQTEAGETVTVLAASESGTLPRQMTVQLADYAGNLTEYQVNSEETEELSGKLIGFLRTAAGNGTADWVELLSENASFTAAGGISGITGYALAPEKIRAAEYHGGYVFMLCDDGGMYAASVKTPGSILKVCSGSDTYGSILDMAYSDADDTLYVLTSEGAVCSMDQVTGALERCYTLSGSVQMVSMTVDSEGNFYGVNAGSGTETRLWKWTAGSGTVTPAAVGTGTLGRTATALGGSMAWDEDNQRIFWANACGSDCGAGQYLMTVDPATGTVTHSSEMYATLNGLFFTDDETESYPAGTLRMELSTASAQMLTGQVLSVEATLYPWTQQDRRIIWETSDADVAIAADGKVTAVGGGTAVISAVSAADSSVKAELTVSVEEVSDMNLTGQFLNTDGSAAWKTFSTAGDAAPQTVRQTSSVYRAGALVGEKLYVIRADDNAICELDPQTYNGTALYNLNSSYNFSDAAPIPEEYQATFGGTLTAVCNAGTRLMLLNTADNRIRYWDNIGESASGDPMAAIACLGETMYQGRRVPHYALLSEQGVLWEFVLSDTGLAYQKIGSTGLSLSGVSQNGTVTASLLFDARSGWLYLATNADGAAKLYAINFDDPEQNTVVRTFAENTAALGVLYQSDAQKRPALTLNSGELTLVPGDEFTLTASFDPDSAGGTLVWESDDAAVAAVSDGKVTAVSAGEATITVRSTDAVSDGTAVEASCRVKVCAPVSVDAEINAQIQKNGHASYVTVDLKDLTVSGLSDAAYAFSAGGVAGGHRYGMHGTDFVMEDYVDPKDNAYDFSNTPAMVVLDLTNAPSMGSSVNMPLYAAEGGIVAFDAENNGTPRRFPTDMELCGLAYAGGKSYFGLDTAGTLYYFSFDEDTSTSGMIRMRMGYPIAELGLHFTDRSAVSMAYLWDEDGLVIADAAAMRLYWVSGAFMSDTPEISFLGTMDADYISCLYGEMELRTSVAANAAEPELLWQSAEKNNFTELVEPMVTEDISPITEPQAVSVGLLRAGVQSGAAAAPDIGANAVRVTVTAMDADCGDTVSTNGRLHISYDPAVLRLEGYSTAAELSACHAENGEITFCYVSTEPIPANAALFVPRFTLLSGTSADLTITHSEVNADCYETVEILHFGQTASAPVSVAARSDRSVRLRVNETPTAGLMLMLAGYDAAGRMTWCVTETPETPAAGQETVLALPQRRENTLRLFVLNGEGTPLAPAQELPGR